MKKTKIVQFLCIGGLLTSLTVLFQSAPVFLPAIGLMLSPFSTLPIAVVDYHSVFLAITVLFSSSFLLLFVSSQEAMILLFTTGILGTVLGSMLYRKGVIVTIPASAIALSLGMIVLTYIAAIPAFADFTEPISFPIVLLIFLLFSLVYVSIWYVFLRKFINYLIKIKLLQKLDLFDNKFISNH